MVPGVKHSISSSNSGYILLLILGRSICVLFKINDLYILSISKNLNRQCSDYKLANLFALHIRYIYFFYISIDLHPQAYTTMYIFMVHVSNTVKPVYNDHVMGYFSAFWSSSRWPRAT